MDNARRLTSGKKYFAIVNFLLFALIIMGLFLLLSYTDEHPIKGQSALYVDFTDCDVYARSGFDSALLEVEDFDTLTDMHAMGWESFTHREYNGSYLVSDLVEPQKGDERVFLSLVNSPDREFTIMIPFELTAEAIDLLHGVTPVVPGVYLAAIGDNWEVFINGKLVAQEMHLDENRQVIDHRCMRGVNFPVDYSILREGKNYIAFRIVASYHSTDAGLFYSSGYYMGDYSQIKTQSLNIPTIIFATIYIFMGLYHLLLFFMRRTERYNLYYSIFTTAIAVFFISRTPIIYLLTQDTSITQRFEYGTFYLLPMFLAAFIEQLNHGRILLPSKIFSVFCVVLVTLQVVFSNDFANDMLAVGQIVTALLILYVVVFDIIIAFVHKIRAEVKKRLPHKYSKAEIWDIINENLSDTPFGNIVIAVILLSATGVFDILDAVIFNTGIVLSEYGFFLFTVSTAFILARNFASNFNRINTVNEMLEEAVQNRTLELKEQVRIAEFASRAKSDFLANMSHEIRTPITAVIGMTSIGKDSKDQVKKDYSFDKISEASNHLLGIISDILDMSKIEANKLELAEVRCNIRDTIKHVTEVMGFKADEKNQKFEVRFDNNVPEWLLGDDQRLAQIITNLLSNAIKFTPENGKVSLSVNLQEEKSNSCLIHFAVADNGIGISEEQQMRLFTSFQQADNSTSRNYGGTGLGLALSKRIVEIMNGNISVVSKIGKGSTFAFTVEMRKIKDFQQVLPELEVEDTAFEDEFAGYTVLLVEDIEINREIVMTIMEPSGINFRPVANGQEAVEIFKQDPESIDMILMDIQMPVMDGYTATRTIRNMDMSKAKDVPIIAMTANVFKEDINNCMDAGMNEHIGKPINANKLATVIRNYIRKTK